MTDDAKPRHSNAARGTAKLPDRGANPLWTEAARLRHAGVLDVSRIVASAAAQGTVVRWRDVADLAMAEGRGGFGRPLYLLDFLEAFARRLAPRSVFDPYVTSPLPLAALTEGITAAAVGVVPHRPLWELGRAMAPAIDWRLGDPLLSLRRELLDGYDLVFVAPPLGLQPPSRAAAELATPAGRDLAGAVLWQARQLLAPGGRLVYHTTDSLFWDAGSKLRQACAEAGLHLTAVISVEAGFAPATNLTSSLAIFEQDPADALFVGRLDARTPITELIDNLLTRRPNPANLHLGALTSLDYPGWGSFVLQRELADAFGAEQLQPLGDLGIVRSLNLRPTQPYGAPPNAVYVPTLGAGAVRTSPPDLEGKNLYRLIEVQLDPAKARADYVAALLSSPIGRRLREAVATGSTLPNIKASALAAVQIPVPAVAVQDEAISAASHLASMEATVARLRGDLWRHPEQARRVVERLESAAKADPVRRWLEALPYPLASVLQRYAVSRDPDARVQSLLNFFEVTAQFACAALLSVFRADAELFRQVQRDLSNAAPPGRQLFDRADFGLWLGLGQTLARNVRRLAGDKDYKLVLAEAAAPAEALVGKLSEKSFWASLDPARHVRNQRAHGGIVSADQLASWLGSLEVQLGRLEQAVGDAFEDVDLALAEEGRYKNGVHTYAQAQRLRGPSAIFEQFELQTREPLESGQLTFVSRDAVISPTLALVPLVRIGPSASRTRHACYFFESRRDGSVSYVSYHFEDEPRIQVRDDDLEHLAQEFNRKAPGS
ncbi:hypothetical protein [Geodermatophilus sp. SYSU D01176]